MAWAPIIRAMSSGLLTRTVVLLALVCALGPPGHAVPIGVRAKTKVELEHRRTPTGMTLVGRLLDDAGQPVANERVTLELPGLPPVTRLTTSDGDFEVPLTAREVARIRQDGDVVTWTVQFDGNSRLGDTAESGSIDLSKRATRLDLAIEGNRTPTADADDGVRVVLGERAVEITVTLNDVSEGAPRPIAQAEVALEVGSGSQLVGATGRSGAATFVVRPASFARGGRYRITARFAGDALRGPSRAETFLTVLVPTRVTLRVVREGDEVHGRYRMSGRVSDESRPLAGQLVAIVASLQDSPATRAFELVAATDADGIFVTALSAVELQQLRDKLNLPRERVRLEVRARVTSADGLHAPSESAAVVLEIPTPPGVPLRWYLLGLALVVSFITLAQLLRSGAMVRALDRLARAIRRFVERLRGKVLPPIVADDEPLFVTRFDAPERKHDRSSDLLSGVVVDAHTRAPLLGTVVARSGDQREVARCDVRGNFRLGPLAHGAWSVTVEAPGHLGREVALELPHDGTYDGAQWALVAVHRSVREIFATTLRGLGTPLAWGYATPREATRDALDARAPERPVIEPPLDELTRIVEHTHFAPSYGTAADVERARLLRDRLQNRPGEGRLNPADPTDARQRGGT